MSNTIQATASELPSNGRKQIFTLEVGDKVLITATTKKLKVIVKEIK